MVGVTSQDPDATARADQPDPGTPPVDPDVKPAETGTRQTAPGATPAGRTSTHGRGNWRSLVISMVVMTVFVLAFVALNPRPAQRELPTVDLERTAGQVATATGWPVATADLGDGWHPTSVSNAPDDKGVPTWLVGYHKRPGDDAYVSLAQTRPGAPLTEAQVGDWTARQSKQGRPDGTSQVGGRAWQRRTVTIDAGNARVRRSLVAAGGPGGLVTVLSGEVDYATLESVAASLRETPAPRATPGASTATG